MKVLFVQTGGTIDKDYPRPSMGYAFEIGGAAVERILKRLNPGFEYRIAPLIKKDSQDLDEQDRLQIRENLEVAEETYCIITHGTDSMLDTARYLSDNQDKVIILTGALKPERFRDSDADINLGVAIGALENLKPGVYIAMSGRVMHWQKVKRNHESGQFYQKD